MIKNHSFIKRFVWKIVRYLRLDYQIAMLDSAPLRKLLPRNTYYSEEEYDFRISNSLSILINRSDYTQWRVFAGLIFDAESFKPYIDVSDSEYVIFDVGANIGAFGSLFVEKFKISSGAIHFFEPNPIVARALKKNAGRVSDLHSGISAIVNEVAVGERNSTMTLKINKDHSGLSSLSNISGFDDEVEVQVIDLDSYIDQLNLKRLDFLKIDVESYEPAVLLGMSRALVRLKPLIYFEYSNAWFANFGDAVVLGVLRFLTDSGYLIQVESRDAWIHQPIDLDNLMKIRHANFLAVPLNRFKANEGLVP